MICYLHGVCMSFVFNPHHIITCITHCKFVAYQFMSTCIVIMHTPLDAYVAHKFIDLSHCKSPECDTLPVLGFLTIPPLPSLHSSCFEVVPKHDGGWLTTCHLSTPHGPSTNNHNDPNLFSQPWLPHCMYV